jgi:hypothetical protein
MWLLYVFTEGTVEGNCVKAEICNCQAQVKCNLQLFMYAELAANKNIASSIIVASDDNFLRENS